MGLETVKQQTRAVWLQVKVPWLQAEPTACSLYARSVHDNSAAAAAVSACGAI